MATSENDAATKGQKDACGNSLKDGAIVYVLGGPGSDKGTQSELIASHFGFCHLTIGDLLKEESETGSETGKMIKDLKSEGKLVPTDGLIELLHKSMLHSKNKRFIIDGFPRNQENLIAAENIMKIEPDIVLFLDCSDREMVRRLLHRKQGRADDNIETIRKRLETYHESTIPVLNYYRLKGKLRRSW